MIQAFEYTYELAWKTLKDLLNYQGFAELIGSRDTLREAFRQALLYGSRAKGSQQPGSDIDLCLQGPLSDSDLLRLLNDLDDLLLPYTLDICRFDALDPIRDASLIAHIQRVGQVFYADSQAKR